MSSTFETGHAKNVANFESLISFCKGFGASYNPSKASQRIAGLEAQLAAAKQSLAQVTTTGTAFNNVTNSRSMAFQPLKTLATQLLNALDATDASPATVKDALGLTRKLRGTRASKKAEAPAVNPDPAAPPADKTISASQLSYDQQVEHFSKLIEILATEGNYQPNENNFKVAALQAKLASLKAANTSVINAYTLLSNDRINRNNLLYNPFTGLIVTAMDIKKYVKSVFGASSAQYKQVSGLEFKAKKD